MAGFFCFPSIEDSQYIPSPDEKDFYTPEEAYELVMSDVRSVYIMKDAV
jgi:hypothetical protein